MSAGRTINGAPRPGKLPGKTEFSGRRRTTTRVSGHHSHPNSTGGELKIEKVPSFAVQAGDIIELIFNASAYPPSATSFMAFGGWVSANIDVDIEIQNSDATSRPQTLVVPSPSTWGKFGSMWPSDGAPLAMTVSIKAKRTGNIAIWGLACGLVEHEFLNTAKKELLRNMFATSPEAHFFVNQNNCAIQKKNGTPPQIDRNISFDLPIKSCNRCARFLPINIPNERIHLSFSNHCVSRRPCKHPGFGRLRNIDTDEYIQLEYGYQLECRFCKKFTVNAAHNKQRTSAQMKEDGTRRRYIEALLTELYGESPQLRYRHQQAERELTDDVWDRFGRSCFNCSTPLPTPGDMRLDHTRPLALLWPLDGSATALCATCNSKKRDRPPVEFYTPDKLILLADITGIPIDELKDPSPNIEAVQLLRGRLEWFFTEFLRRPQLMKERDGKIAGELLVKALQKAINKCPPHLQFDLEGEQAR